MKSDLRAGRGPAVHAHKRVLRALLSVCAFSTYLAGYRVSPAWIFALSTLSIYLMTSAMLGTGLVGALLRLAGGRVVGDTVSMDLNIGGWDRALRGALALFVIVGVMVGVTMLLDTLDYFLLMLVAFYGGMTALIAWDPVYALFGMGTRRSGSSWHATDVVSLRPRRVAARRRAAAKTHAA